MPVLTPACPAIISMRVWWLNRKLGKQLRNTEAKSQGGVIEGEYRVVKRDEKP